MPSTRNLVLIASTAFCVGAAGIVASKRFIVDPPTAPTTHRAAPAQRAQRAPSVWEQAAEEQAAHEQALEAEVLAKAARERAEIEKAELELAAEEKTDPQQEALERIARDRQERIESALAFDPLAGARKRANESAAIATLRTTVAAQAQAQARLVIDTNADGNGEYAYFGELAGLVPVRAPGASGATLGTETINPPLVTSDMGEVRDGGMGHGAIERSGYLFKIFLPDADGAGVPEAVTGGATGVVARVDPERSEKLFCAYAWPITCGQTGDRAFFINQDGDVYEYRNEKGTYDGTQAAPTCFAAFTRDSMSSRSGKDWTILE